MDDSASPEEYPDFEDAYLIKNEFADGEICEKMFPKIYNIYTELYDRLISLDPSNAADYDSKFDCILDYMLYIDHYLCIKMYDYGVMFAEKYNRK